MKKIETLEELNEAINCIDWGELHIMRLEYNDDAWLYWDGLETVEIEIESHSTYPGQDNAVFMIFKCDLDIDAHYSEGWAEQDDNGNYLTNDGRTLTPIEMARECIQYGDFSDAYEFWRDEIITNFTGY
jgi:hypothetical protein